MDTGPNRFRLTPKAAAWSVGIAAFILWAVVVLALLGWIGSGFIRIVGIILGMPAGS